MDILGDGLLSNLLARIDPQLRPIVEITLVAIVLGAAIAAALDRLVSLAHRAGMQLIAFGRWVRRLIFRPPPPPPPPPLGRTIPTEQTIWELRAPEAAISPITNGVPIITVAAMKGGVGKTTVAANLAVYFKHARGKPVLLIDFDYQGSLSECVRGEAGYTDRDITSDVLLRPESEFPQPEVYAREMRRSLEDVFLFPADYPLATIENHLMIAWVQNGENDLMYRLCNHLRKPAFQQRFGAIIIDSPPRLTTGSINALCASTHLLVPTTLDDMSAQAAEYFLTQIDRMQNAARPLFAKLKVIGVVPSIVSSEGAWQLQEARALDRLQKFGTRLWKRGNFVLEEARIPKRADIARVAGLGVAALRSRSAAQIFDRLGRAVELRL